MKIINKSKLEMTIEEYANCDMENGYITGVSYFVWQKGEMVYKKHFGTVGVDSDTPVSDKTMFRIASMTKPITTIALLILVDRGLVSLDDKVSKYLRGFDDIHVITPEGEDMGVTKTPVTILHCLSHSSGFGSLKEERMTESDVAHIDSLLKYYFDEGLAFEPFTRDAYSGYGAHDIIAKIIELVTGEDFFEFIKREILIPCNMPNTTFNPTDEQWQNFVMMHDRVDGKNARGRVTDGCIFEGFPCTHKLAGAGFASTLDDYSNFAVMLLNKGEFKGHRIISEETFNKMTVPYIKKCPLYDCESWGLSVRIVTDSDLYGKSVEGKLPAGAYGWSGAYGSHFWIDPENEICAVYMKNSRFDGGAGSVTAQRFEKAVFESLE